MVWDALGYVTVGGVALVIGGAILGAFASRDFSITSARRLRVELRALVMITGFRSLVLLFNDRLELGGRVPPADRPSCFRFRFLVLPGSLSVFREIAESIDMSRR